MHVLSERFRLTILGAALAVVALLVAVFQIVAAGHCDRTGMLCWVCPLLLPLEWAARASGSSTLGAVVLAGCLLHWPLLGLVVDRRRASLRRDEVGGRRPDA